MFHWTLSAWAECGVVWWGQDGLMEKAGHQVQQGLAATGLTQSCCPALPGESMIWDTEKRKAPFRKAVCFPQVLPKAKPDLVHSRTESSS